MQVMGQPEKGGDRETGKRADRFVLGCGLLAFGVPFACFLATGSAVKTVQLCAWGAGLGMLVLLVLGILRLAGRREDDQRE